ncbi:DUF4397 domain-containing protein [Chitinophaga pendula]|uniref:DUF4397 domain-containing protein n=1 Tax=Chitinophaga TaxID=79328 RepID=UPI000BAEA8E7|nr:MULTISPECIES: DUF4397 domain-containing protein [Chitinophaga]ASZ11279.1 hypothetical protein CK934_10025 [Chitinophaga sp. MD30]UCJ05721.1 DUF4397 domain-containing protein [Chitinophaga pendula]
MKYTCAKLLSAWLLSGALISSCVKEKEDLRSDNRVINDARKASNIRLVNPIGYNQVVINGDTLTNYVIIPKSPQYPQWEYPGTTYFPSNGRLGNNWSIPRSLLKDDGTAMLKVEMNGFQLPLRTLEFKVQEDHSRPMDYYLLAQKEDAFVIDAPPSVMPIPRSINPSPRPDHFKIRVVNMAARLADQGANVENVALPLTLTYADGNTVSALTSNIAPGQYSEYVEVPYGTYQFKILTPAGTQVAAHGGSLNEDAHKTEPTTSTIAKDTSGRPHAVSTGLTYAPIRTYQPGGIYTIVITPKKFIIPYYNGNPGEEVDMMQNGFDVIADISEPYNYQYTRIQWVNALPGSAGITMHMNGRKMDDGLSFAASSNYMTTVAEKTAFKAIDAAGKEIASAEYQLKAGDNYSVWLYEDAAGKAMIHVVTNNLSGIYTTIGNGGQDATYDRFKRSFSTDIRFLNYCPDLPYITFTGTNGQPFTSGVNMALAQIPAGSSPYARFGATAVGYQIMAYRSTPSVIPGRWLEDIPVVKSEQLIARRALYVRNKLPIQEPGVYTIALIGGYKNNTPSAQKARMIIVKHTK